MAKIYEVDTGPQGRVLSKITDCWKLACKLNPDNLSPTTYNDLINYAATLQDMLEGALEEQAEYERQQTSGLRPDF